MLFWFLPYNNMNESYILFHLHSYSSSLCGKTCPWFLKTVSWLLYLIAWKSFMWPEIHFIEKLSMPSSFCLMRNILLHGLVPDYTKSILRYVKIIQNRPKGKTNLGLECHSRVLWPASLCLSWCIGMFKFIVSGFGFLFSLDICIISPSLPTDDWLNSKEENKYQLNKIKELLIEKRSTFLFKSNLGSI